MLFFIWFLLVGSTVVNSLREKGDTRPNIITYFPDTIRSESLSTYGHPFVSTPNVDRLASQGTQFMDAHAQHSQCTPSRCAVLTGRYMHVLGHRTQTHLIQNSEPNVFKYLKESGYTTIMLGKNDMLSIDSFNSSFSYWEEVIGVDGGGAIYTDPATPGYFSFANLVGEHLGNNSQANEDLLAVEYVSAFMANNPPEPFAIWISGVGGHPPYTAPKDFFSLYTAEQVKAQAPLRPVLPGANKPAFIGTGGIPGFRNLNSLPETFFYEQAAVYLGRMSYMDYVLGVLMDGIEASPLAASTALIFTSDHGDYSGDWHNVEKYPCALDDVLTHVPFIAKVPGGVAGAKITAPIETIDLFATLLDLAGLLPNATAALTSTTIERHFSNSLLPTLLGAPGAKQRRYAYSEGGYSPGTLEVEPLDPEQKSVYNKPTNMYYPRGLEELTVAHCTRATMQKNGTSKLVYRTAPAQSELYDLVKDPQELQNVW